MSREAVEARTWQDACFDEGCKDAIKFLEQYGEAEFKKVFQEQDTSQMVFLPGNLLEKLRQWNGVFKAKMEERRLQNQDGRCQRRRTTWRSIDAR